MTTTGLPNNIIHPTRARASGFSKVNVGQVMMGVGQAEESIETAQSWQSAKTKW